MSLVSHLKGQDMALLAKGTWAVVMDEERAIVLENIGTVEHPQFQEVERLSAVPLAPYSDRPGRAHESVGQQRSAMEQPDLDRIAGARLAADVVAHLRKVSGTRPLVIGAPPHLLGAVRDELARQGALSGPAKLNLLCTLDKTLTGHPPAKLPPILQAALDAV
jgi:protein required for attachment to host cells